MLVSNITNSKKWDDSFHKESISHRVKLIEQNIQNEEQNDKLSYLFSTKRSIKMIHMK